MEYLPTIGLEVHVQLDTRTKIFCSCSTEYSGAAPNTFVCPVCLGLPGVLPVLNEAVVEKAAQVVLAIGGEVQLESRFDRKNYFYPDLPKGYQISQFDRPIGRGGHLQVVTDDGRTVEVRIVRAHMEEDAGKLVHAEDGSGALVDYNRAGVPLLEIVTGPDMHSPEEARQYLVKLKAVLEYIEASDCNMEEGSLRCDANVSIAPPGKPLGTRVEIKNMNSFRNVVRAVTYEIERQRAVLGEGGKVVQETRLWDDPAGRTRSMRSKEESEDYRYFPEPDLPPVRLDPARVEAWRETLPELPEAKRERFVASFGLSPYDADVLTQVRERAVYFEAALAAAPSAPKAVCNWITTELLGRLGDEPLAAAKVRPGDLARLVAMVEAGEVNGKQAKTLFARMFETGRDPGALRSELGMENVTDDAAIRTFCRQAMDANPESVASYRAGKVNALKHLVGQVMKLSRGAAAPQKVNDILKELLEA